MATHSYDQFIAACAGYPKPNPFASDWCITDVGEAHEYRLPPSINRAKSLADADEWAMAIKCSVTAEVSVLVYAKSEKAAPQPILRYRKSVVKGKRGSVMLDHGCSAKIKK